MFHTSPNPPPQQQPRTWKSPKARLQERSQAAQDAATGISSHSRPIEHKGPPAHKVGGDDGKPSPVDVLRRLLRNAHVRSDPMPHQRAGMQWWLRRERAGRGVGGVLADDKGLGKSFECIAAVMMADEQERQMGAAWSAPTLIVLPLAVLSQWVEQIAEHTDLDTKRQVFVYHGLKPRERENVTLEQFRRDDVRFVLTTYDMVRRAAVSDPAYAVQDVLMSTYWRRVVLDEADTVRNRTTAVHKAVKRLQSGRRWGLTGTPINNKTEDIQSLAEFIAVQPYSDPQWWKHATPQQQQAWRADYVLRRDKSVLTLPAKYEVPLTVVLSPEEQRMYASLEAQAVLEFQGGAVGGNANADEEGADATEDKRKFFLRLLEWLNRLRQVACHPRMVVMKPRSGSSMASSAQACGTCARKPSGTRTWRILPDCQHRVCPSCDRGGGAAAGTTATTATPAPCAACVRARQCAAMPERSAKQAAVVDRITELRKEEPSTKILVYSQWIMLLDLMDQDLTKRGVATLRIDGSMSQKARKTSVEQFVKDDRITAPHVMLATLKSGGVGLNLMRASVVFIMDPWYNPTAEDQAMDRVYRIGQTRPVLIYKVLTDTLVERAVAGLQAEKRLKATAFLQPTTTDAKTAKEEVDESAPKVSDLVRIFMNIIRARNRRDAAGSATATATMEDEEGEGGGTTAPLEHRAPAMVALHNHSHAAPMTRMTTTTTNFKPGTMNRRSGGFV